MTAHDGHFAQALEALRARLGELVIIGGWAHRLHRLHPWATTSSSPPLTTDDLDLAAPDDMPSTPSLADALVNAGFREELGRDEDPPVTRWTMDGFEIELLTNLTGSLNKRRRRDATARVGGTTAQRLRHIDLLLVAPWEIRLDSTTDPAAANPVHVRVPNAVTYIVQKLIASERTKGDQAKDVLYVFDTLRLFADAQAELRGLWKGVVGPALSEAHRRKARRRVEQLTASADEVIGASRIARRSGRTSPPGSAEIAAVCLAGVSSLIGV